jgi:hypothetical protein
VPEVRRPASPDPYEVFDRTIERVEGLLRLHPVLCVIGGRPKRYAGDILRSAIVLAVRALDALVLDSVVAALPRAEQEGTLMRSVARWVKDDAEGSLALLGEREVDFASQVAELCRRRLGQPKPLRTTVIEGVIRDVLQRDGPWPRAAEILSSNGGDWDPSVVKARLDEIAQREHDIASGGDLLPDSTSRRIQLTYVAESVSVIRAVGSAVSETFGVDSNLAARSVETR